MGRNTIFLGVNLTNLLSLLVDPFRIDYLCSENDKWGLTPFAKIDSKWQENLELKE